MSKRSSIANKSVISGVKETSTVSEESGIRKHYQFWDKKNKGYITPLDTISGFITLGYSVIFSVAIGVVVGIFLSLSTQTGWFPDLLCRSNVSNLIRAKKQTEGAFDVNGVLIPEKFDSLFHKYAKSDKSGNTITVAELVRMTKEQERLGKDVKAWATSMAELCTAYFFIGRRGYLTREDVRSAYDGTLFYRLKDTHRLMIEQGSVTNIDSSKPGIEGSYLASSHGRLSVKGIEHRLQSLLKALQSKPSADYRVSYIQECTDSIKKMALPRPASAISGVTTPKASIYRSSNRQPQDPASLFSDGITGVAKSNNTEGLIWSEDILNSFLKERSDEEIESSKETYKIGEEPNSSKDEGELLASITSSQPVPEKSISSITSNSPVLNEFLRGDDSKAYEGLTGLAGVQGSTKHHDESTIAASSSSSSNAEVSSREGGHIEDTSSKNDSNIPVEESPPPSQQIEQQSLNIPKSAITPPPEEKISVDQHKNTNKKTNVNSKKARRNKNGKGTSGRLSPTSSSDSGQEQQDSLESFTPAVSA